MPEMNEYVDVSQDARSRMASPVVYHQPMTNTSYADDVEIIDLDNSRGQIKPTTWH